MFRPILEERIVSETRINIASMSQFLAATTQAEIPGIQTCRDILGKELQKQQDFLQAVQSGKFQIVGW